MADFDQCPRYDKHELNDDQIEAIAERAAQKALVLARDDIYKDVGHTVLSGIKWLVGIGSIAIFAWLVKMGWIKP